MSSTSAGGTVRLAGMTTDNKTIVTQALQQMVATGGTDALEPLLREDFVHHKPDSTSSTKTEWLADVRAVPIDRLRVEILHLLADGDHVMLSTRRWLDGGGPGIAAVDIWRLEDGLITEAWELVEPLADVAANLAWWRADAAA
jgi:predicted SnoaL-like aldol condensation-catalyzing enzyme